ncbi:hypothetical protein Tco_1450260 [Tanacetum coccineum]
MYQNAETVKAGYCFLIVLPYCLKHSSLLFLASNDRSVWRDLFAVVGLGPAVVVAAELSFSVGRVSDIRRGTVETIVSAMSFMMSCVGVLVRSSHGASCLFVFICFVTEEMTVGINSEKQKQVDKVITSLAKCAALQERVGGWEWADMMALYCQNAVEEDNEFARRMDAVPGVAAAVKTAEFLNEALWKDDRRIQRLWKLQIDANLMAYEKEKFTEKL